jgi:hypothetical protein
MCPMPSVTRDRDSSRGSRSVGGWRLWGGASDDTRYLFRAKLIHLKAPWESPPRAVTLSLVVSGGPIA